jgi:Cu/Ag efflux protein CusF
MRREEFMVALVAAVCVAFTLVGCASSSKRAAAAAAEPVAGMVSNTVSATATVKALDLKTRMVTLQRADGSLIKFRAGEEVRNLPQLKVGDEVTVTFVEAIAFEVKKPGEAVPGVAFAEGIERAEPGEKPGGAVGQVVTVTATIAGIDKNAQTVTLRGPDGDLETIKVRNPQNLERVDVGDLVEITYTEALGISVETPGN